MANLRDLRRRIRSIKNTAQITKAMQMVAATKMRRAQAQALAGRPYLQTLNSALDKLLQKGSLAHPFLQTNDSSEKTALVFTPNRALCGALNTNLFRFLMNFQQTNQITQYQSVGKKGRIFLAKSNWNLTSDFENNDTTTFEEAARIARMLINSFRMGQVKEVYLVYPDFISTIRQEPKAVKILPIERDSLMVEDLSGDKPEAANGRSEFLIEPNKQELLDYLFIHLVEMKIYQAFLETKASEQSARMIAMQNATDNAKELVEDLTLSYNQQRQEGITNELLTITSALAALE